MLKYMGASLAMRRRGARRLGRPAGQSLQSPDSRDSRTHSDAPVSPLYSRVHLHAHPVCPTPRTSPGAQRGQCMTLMLMSPGSCPALSADHMGHGTATGQVLQVRGRANTQQSPAFVLVRMFIPGGGPAQKGFSASLLSLPPLLLAVPNRSSTPSNRCSSPRHTCSSSGSW